VESSFAKYLAPQLDRPLPEAAARLIILPAIDAKADHEKQHARRCPHCGAFYQYLQSHEYLANGTEDEEELHRLSPSQTQDFCLAQAVLLERLRREIDDLQGAAGSLGDYIDRGRPNPSEEEQAYEAMQRHRRDAERLRARLQALVETLRRDAPEILAAWAAAHVRVCRSLLASLPDRSEDGQTARFVARAALEAWEKLPRDGEAFIAIATPWLEGYLERLAAELAPAGPS
jgi:hypothetical protein